MIMAETLDLCIIGTGPGALSVAMAAAAMDVRTVLVAKPAVGAPPPGAIANALLAAAKRAQMVRDSAPFGIAASSNAIEFDKVSKHVQRALAAIAPNTSPERLAGLGVQVLNGPTKFRDRYTVIAGAAEIRARHFVIATGSTLAVPEIPGLREGRYLTAETVIDLAGLPDRLVVIGGSWAALELAQALRRLGSQVTVLEAAASLAPFDPECAAVVLEQLRREGIAFRSGVKLLRVKYAGLSAAVTFEDQGREETVEGRQLLVACGRKPAIDDLDLEVARIKHDADGIKVNNKLQTSNARVYAIGDVVAGQQAFAQAGLYHAELVIRNMLLRLPTKLKSDLVPYLAYTDPELAQIGISEAAARERKYKIRILRWPYYDNTRAQAEREFHGHTKIITTVKGQILGASIVGAEARESVAMWSLAIAQGLNISSVAQVVLPHPSFTEIGKRAALEFFAAGLTASRLQRIMARLRIFG
jgi:pyruvate/2-oxoglutarate dehydrogenase complex dihydrolipoamide dehydrogenase (E3) component